MRENIDNFDDVIKSRAAASDLVRRAAKRDRTCSSVDNLRILARDAGLEYIAETAYEYRDADEDDEIRPF